MIYYTELHWRSGERYFVGIFSSTELAKAACQKWHDQLWSNTDALTWVGHGDSLNTKDTISWRFDIDALELDAAIRPPKLYSYSTIDDDTT